MARAANDINTIYKKLSTNPEILDPESLIDEINKAYTNFSSRPVSPEVNIEDYKDQYDRVYYL